MTPDEIDAAEIEDHMSDCAKDRHRWNTSSAERREQQCLVCKSTMNDKQIALLRPEPRTAHIETLYEGMVRHRGGMDGTSIVYENGLALEHTRRDVTVTYAQYEILQALGKVVS